MVRCWKWAVPALALAGIGCGKEAESGPKVVGHVQINGQPCRPVSVMDFELLFKSTGDGPVGKSYAASVEEDGTFTFHGAIGKGVPPGHYKVVINGAVVEANGKPTRRFLATFMDKNTPLVVDVTNDTRAIIIDLEKKTVEAS